MTLASARGIAFGSESLLALVSTCLFLSPCFCSVSASAAVWVGGQVRECMCAWMLGVLGCVCVRVHCAICIPFHGKLYFKLKSSRSSTLSCGKFKRRSTSQKPLAFVLTLCFSLRFHKSAVRHLPERRAYLLVLSREPGNDPQKTNLQLVMFSFRVSNLGARLHSFQEALEVPAFRLEGSLRQPSRGPHRCRIWE